jgi:hypothetical protein
MEENRDKVRAAIERALLEDPIRALKDLAWLLPKELMISGEVSTTVKIDPSLITPDVLREAFQARRDAEAIEHNPETGPGQPDSPIH